MKFNSGKSSVCWSGNMAKAHQEVLDVLAKNGLSYLETLVILESLPPYLGEMAKVQPLPQPEKVYIDPNHCDEYGIIADEYFHLYKHQVQQSQSQLY